MPPFKKSAQLAIGAGQDMHCDGTDAGSAQHHTSSPAATLPGAGCPSVPSAARLTGRACVLEKLAPPDV